MPNKDPFNVRIACVPVDDPILQKVSRNALFTTFERAYNTAFNSEVLPDDQENWVFKVNDPRARLYTSKRKWLATDEPNRDYAEFEYEKLLEQVFWSRRNKATALVVIEGDVGSGKSTLIEYFLRCYCPTESERKEEFKKKLPIIVNLSNVCSDNYESEIYRKIREEITKKIDFELDSDDCYAMYDPVLNFDGKLFLNALGDKDEEQYRAECVQSRKNVLTDKDWVELALRYLSTKSAAQITEGQAAQYEYLVICLDNIDQRSEDVQLRTVELANRWLKELKLRLWQLYIPVWPKTYDKLIQNPSISPIGDHEFISLGTVDPEEVIKKRNELHIEEVLGDEDATDPPGDPAKTSGQFGIHFLEDTFSFVRSDFIRTLRDLSGGNLRTERDLWKQMLSSKSLYQNYLDSNSRQGWDEDKKMGLYNHWDGLITGSRDVHHRTRSKLRNLFYATATPRNGRDLLIGVHLLLLLEKEGSARTEITIKPFNKRLRSYGYDDDAIEEAMAYFQDTMFTIFPSKGGDRIRIRQKIVRQYLCLLRDPAYLDNMAMTTPVPENLHPKMKITNSFDPKNFCDRVFTTLNFLMQINRDEDYFCEPKHCTSGLHPDIFVGYLSSYKIHRVFLIAIQSYKERLDALKSLKKLTRTVRKDQWDAIFNHEAFKIERMREGHDFLEVIKAD